ncbi:MAG: M48 family peptidase, partial [Deltaproteobacteria bacterium]|nr:M48 family peptidase [Deltaproteobacteria bacterium]
MSVTTLIRKNFPGSTRAEALKPLFADAFQQVAQRRMKPEIDVAFYPFAGLNHTIRIRNQRVYVRVSDILRDAPQQVHQALAFILVAKLFNQRAKAEYESLYRQYAYQPQILRASDLARRNRGRKQLTGSSGHTYDLNRLFARLNRIYFESQIPKPILSWSVRRTKRILGHHDAIHEAIVISRSLDDEAVPDFVIEYVLYHEMLHIK